MIFSLLLWLAAASAQTELVDEAFLLPAAEWRYVELRLSRPSATVICRYEAPPGSRVRAALLPAEDLARMRNDEPHGVLVATPAGERGGFRHSVHQPGDYYVVVDNRNDGARAARVTLRVSLDFAASGRPAVRTLSPRRRAVVIAVSCLFFVGVVGFAGRSLLRGLRR
jgi:hypothetical protein